MATRLITLSTKRPGRGTAIVLSLMFGVIFAGLGGSYLAIADPSADPLAILVVLLWAFWGWLAFQLFLLARWPAVGILSFASHTVVTLAVAVVCSAIIWPPAVVVIYSPGLFSGSTILIVCAVCPAIVAGLTHAAYRLALRAAEPDERHP